MICIVNGRPIIESILLDKMLIESDAPFSKGFGKNYSPLFSTNIFKYLFESEKCRRIV